MKDITVIRQVFALDELSPAARSVAIEKLRTDNYENLPCEAITSSLYGQLAFLLGDNDIDGISTQFLENEASLTLEWSLGGVQGDGVAIYGEIYNDYATQLTWGNAVYAKLTRNCHGTYYSHYNCFDVELFVGEGDFVNDNGVIANELRTICKKLARYGYAEIENFTSEESVIELLNNNDTPRIFNADGTLAPSQFWAAL